MKRLVLCLMVVCLLALPAISRADASLAVVPNLAGTWSLQLASVDTTGAVTAHTATMTLTQANKPGFYSGHLTGATSTTDTLYVTMVQEGADVRFTFSSADTSTYRTRTWGVGLAGAKTMGVQWSNDIGLTGIGKAVKQ